MRDEIPYEVYEPYHQMPFVIGMMAYVRTARLPEQAFSSIRQVVNGLDPNLPVSEMKTLDNENRDYTSEAISRVLGVHAVEPMLVSADCVDGFLACYWNRPEAYVDPDVQAGISGIARLPDQYVEDAMARLADDLATGCWADRHADLLDRREIDAGYRLVVAQ